MLLQLRNAKVGRAPGLTFAHGERVLGRRPVGLQRQARLGCHAQCVHPLNEGTLMLKAPVRFAVAIAAAAGLVLAAASPAHALADPVDLGTADAFAVLGATTVTNTGPTIVSGDIGLSPGTSVTGFPPGIQSQGAGYIAEGVSGQAQIDANAAYVSGSNQTGSPGPAVVVAPELGGLVFTPDLYQSSGVLQITGNVTLDGGGDPTALFIFRSTSTFITASASSMTLINGASACNVYFIVPSSATLGVGSQLAGTILALESITATTGADVTGRLIALTGAVTLDTNDITSTGCAPVTVNPGSGITFAAPAAPAVPTLPAAGPRDVLAIGALAGGLLALGAAGILLRRRNSLA